MTTTTDTTTDTITIDLTGTATTDEIADKLFEAILGSFEVQAAYLGDRLGWYEALGESGPLTSVELAQRTDSDERYAREWLEHQTVSGYLAVVDATAGPVERRYYLPETHRPVFADRDSLTYLLPFARMTAGFGQSLDDLVEVYRHGGGVSWAHHGADGRESQADANRPMFLQLLAQEYLASIPAVDEALRNGGRVADVGCGFGWSSIGIARAYPTATVDGYDVDGPSVEAARESAAEYDVADRVTFTEVDLSALDHDQLNELGSYDLVLALECIHDMPDPVSVLAGMRALAGDHGTVIVMDERVGENFTGEPDPVERIMYGYSIVGCLPDGRAHDHSAMTGTVMRPPVLRTYAAEAGFSGVTELPIENDFFRFYQLNH